MKEEWKDIKGFEGIYQVSNYGIIKSLDRYDSRNRFRKGRIMPLLLNTDGYFQLKLCKDGRYNTVAVHRIVAKHFLEYPIDGKIYEVNHIDRDRTNNRVDNLEYLTHKENVRHSSITGSYSRFGDRNSRAVKILMTDNLTGNKIKFNTIDDCCKCLKEEMQTETKETSIRDSIRKCLINKTKYFNRYEFKRL